MASLSTRSFRRSHASPDRGLPAVDHSWEVVESHGDGEEDAAAAAADLDIGEVSAYSLATGSQSSKASASKSASSSSDWTMLASIGSMFRYHDDEDDDDDTGRTRARGPQPPLEKETLAHLCRRVEARRGRSGGALFPEPLATPADARGWGAQLEALGRQRERRADADSLRVLEYWTARRERDRRLGGHSDAASLRRLDYWTERLGRGERPEPRPSRAGLASGVLV